MHKSIACSVFSLAIDCPEGMVFQQCGPFCPQTCDNMNVICEGRCAEGCFCPVGQFLLDGKCVDAHVCTGKMPCMFGCDIYKY